MHYKVTLSPSCDRSRMVLRLRHATTGDRVISNSALYCTPLICLPQLLHPSRTTPLTAIGSVITTQDSWCLSTTSNGWYGSFRFAIQYFSSLDLRSTYPIREEERPLTAFEGDGHLLQFCVIPFGVTNSRLQLNNAEYLKEKVNRFYEIAKEGNLTLNPGEKR